jgi:hypothetical protein
MVRRWVKRVVFAGVLVVLVLVPAQLAQGPSNPQGIPLPGGPSSAPFQGWSPTLVVVGVLGALTLLAAWRRHRIA